MLHDNSNKSNSKHETWKLKRAESLKNGVLVVKLNKTEIKHKNMQKWQPQKYRESSSVNDVKDKMQRLALSECI